MTVRQYRLCPDRLTIATRIEDVFDIFDNREMTTRQVFDQIDRIFPGRHSFSSVNKTMHRMFDKGLLTVRKEPWIGKMHRNLWRLTDAG